MKIATVATTEKTSSTVIDVYDELVADLGAVPDLLILYCSAEYAYRVEG